MRGYGVTVGVFHGIPLMTAPAYQALVKEAERNHCPPFVLDATGEVLPRYENCVSLAPDTKDALGIPVLRINYAYSENAKEMVKDATEAIREMADAAGFSIFGSAAFEPGLSIHEVGTARMGKDPKKSVLNAFNQSWDVKNLFVTDGASHVTSSFQNPTLTMMALTVRACNEAIARLKRNDL
jgi:choline dehydrogenase-like flavoprotein